MCPFPTLQSPHAVFTISHVLELGTLMTVKVLEVAQDV